MRILLFLLVMLPLSSFADVVTVDFVKVLGGHDEEAIYYYENNWIEHRIEARERGYIRSFEMLVRTSDDGQADILLITAYADEAQYEDREAHFAEVMRTGERAGPLLLNATQPGEFREVYDGGVYRTE